MGLVGRCGGRGRGRSRGGKGSLVSTAAAAASSSVFLLPAAAAGDPPGAVVVDPVLLLGVEELAFVLVVAEAAKVRRLRLGQVVDHGRMGHPLRLTAAQVGVGRDLVVLLLLLTLVVVVLVPSNRGTSQVSPQVSRMVEVMPKAGELVGGMGRQVAPGHHLVGVGGGGGVIMGISWKHHIDHVVVGWVLSVVASSSSSPSSRGAASFGNAFYAPRRHRGRHGDTCRRLSDGYVEWLHMRHAIMVSVTPDSKFFQFKMLFPWHWQARLGEGKDFRDNVRIDLRQPRA